LGLEAAAGYAQNHNWSKSNVAGAVGPCDLTYFCDQPFDNWWVKFGIYLHDKYGEDKNSLTEEIISQSLDAYIKDNMCLLQ